MDKLLKTKPFTLNLVTQLIFFLCAINLVQSANAETWTRLSTLIFDDSYANLDIVPLNGQRHRAYYMREASIGSALSTDDGETFTDEGTVISGGAHHALIKINNNSFRIYYSTNDSDDFISATSSDGTTFEQEAGTRITGAGKIIHPSAIALSDGTIKIFYDQEVEGDLNFGRKIRSLSCDSTGLTCTLESGIRIQRRNDCDDLTRTERQALKRRGVLCNVNLVFSPFLEFDSATGLYRLYFTAEGNRRSSGVYLATSQNGRRFRIRNKVLGVNPNTTVEDGSLGLPGNPQDAYILTQNDLTKRMFVWETDDGIYSAVRN